jgi:putative oxidoreductase
MDIVKQYGPLVGRILFGLLFLIYGIEKITGFQDTVGYMQAHNIPMTQYLAVIATIVEIAGSLMIIVGWKARIGAAAIFLYVLVLTLIFHPYWIVPQDQMQLQMIMFFKNLAIMGGMLYIIVYGSGPLSVDKNR